MWGNWWGNQAKFRMQFSNTICYKTKGYKSKWWSLLIPKQPKTKPKQENKKHKQTKKQTKPDWKWIVKTKL